MFLTFFGEVNEAVTGYSDMNWRELSYMIPLCVAVVVFGIYPAPVLDVMRASVGKLVVMLSLY